MIKKMIHTFRSLSAPKKSAIAFMLSSFIHQGISFLVTPLFSRLLSTADFGLVTTYNSWTEMLAPLATLSLYSGFFNVGLLDYEDSRDPFVSATMGLASVSTLIVMTAVIIIQLLWPNLVGIPVLMLLLMTLHFLFTPATRFWSARERFEFRYKRLFFVTVATSLLTPVFGLVAVFLADSDLGTARLVGTNVAGIAVGVFFYITLTKKGKKFYDKKIWVSGLQFCIPLIPHYLAMHILSASDRVMINNMTGSANAGIYGMAYTASMVVTVAWSAIHGSLTPYVLGKLKERKFQDIEKTSMQCIMLFSGLCIFVCMVAPEVIYVLGGEKYAESVDLLPPLFAAILFMEMYNLFSIVEFYHKKTKMVMLATVLAAVLNLILNAIAIPRFGYQVAAYTTLICYIMYCFFHYMNMRKIEPEKIYDWKKIVIFSVVYVVICLSCVFLYDYPILRYALIVAVAVIAVLMRKRIMAMWSKMKRKSE